MKKLFLISAVLFLVTVGNVWAEDFDYSRAYRDYEYNYSVYQLAHDDYVLAKARYLQYQTLVSRDEAQKATLIMLQARDEVIKTLLTAIRMRIRENKGLADSEKESLYKTIDPEVKYYTEHKINLASAGSLADLARDSDLAKDHYNSVTNLVIYSSLVSISTGKTGYERKQLEKIILDLKIKIVDIKLAGDKDVSFLDRLFIDIENKFLRSRDKEIQAKETILSGEKSFKDKTEYYNEAISGVQGSFLYLKEAVSYLKEAIRLIKTK